MTFSTLRQTSVLNRIILQYSRFNLQYFRIDLQCLTGIIFIQTGVRDAFDTVVLTLPVPQALKIPGTIQEIYRDQSTTTKRLEAVEYSSRYALGNNIRLHNLERSKFWVFQAFSTTNPCPTRSWVSTSKNIPTASTCKAETKTTLSGIWRSTTRNETMATKMGRLRWSFTPP